VSSIKHIVGMLQWLYHAVSRDYALEPSIYSYLCVCVWWSCWMKRRST